LVEEKEAYEGFQRNRGDKVILVRMSCAEKMNLTNDQRSRSHIKGKVFKNVILPYPPLISFLLSDSGTDYHQLDPQSYWALHEPYQQQLEF
jgi:hypothetical protein